MACRHLMEVFSAGALLLLFAPPETGAQADWDCTVRRCPAGQEEDCFTAVTGVCSPAGLKSDEFCDERHNCGVKDPRCDFAEPRVRHANLNSYGGVDGPVAAMSRVVLKPLKPRAR